MPEIVLKTGEIVLVDAADFEHVAALKWHIGGDGYVKHSFRAIGKVNSLYLHTLLTGLKLVDHHNGNKLDNQRSNLRPATGSQNSCNKKKKHNSSSRFKGVYWHNQAGKWAASMGKNSRIYLGMFEDEVEAGRAYNTAALKRYGPFAKLNEI